jgi:hypothetical protein
MPKEPKQPLWELDPDKFKQYVTLRRLRARMWLIGIGAFFLVSLAIALMLTPQKDVAGVLTLLVNGLVGLLTAVVGTPLNNGGNSNA